MGCIYIERYTKLRHENRGAILKARTTRQCKYEKPRAETDANEILVGNGKRMTNELIIKVGRDVPDKRDCDADNAACVQRRERT